MVVLNFAASESPRNILKSQYPDCTHPTQSEYPGAGPRHEGFRGSWVMTMCSHIWNQCCSPAPQNCNVPVNHLVSWKMQTLIHYLWDGAGVLTFVTRHWVAVIHGVTLPQGYFAPRVSLVMSGDIFGHQNCWRRVALLASSGCKLGMLLPQQRIF